MERCSTRKSLSKATGRSTRNFRLHAWKSFAGWNVRRESRDGGFGSGQPANNESKRAGMRYKAIVFLVIILTLASVHLAEAQQATKVPRIGILTNVLSTAPEVLPLWEAFRQGLSERGWVEGGVPTSSKTRLKWQPGNAQACSSCGKMHYCFHTEHASW